MNRKLRCLVYLLVAAFAALVLGAYLPPQLSWAGFWFGIVLGAVSQMVAILVNDHAEGGLPK